MIKLHNGDCLEIMKNIKDKSINLIVIDPPYNIGKAKWDKWKTVNDYVEFMGKVFTECERVLKDNGSFYFFHNDFEQMSELQYWLKRNTNFIFRRMIVWDKFNGTPWHQLKANVSQSYNRNYPQQAEYILFYTFDDTDIKKRINVEVLSDIQKYLREGISETCYEYKDIAKILKVTEVAVKHWFNDDKNPRLPSRKNYIKLQEILRLSMSYDDLKNMHIKEQEKRSRLLNNGQHVFNNQNLPSVWLHEPIKQNGHITPKPVPIIENIINTSSNEWDIVLDCFMGSGSTGVACRNLNRKFIGIELDEKYFNLAKNRLSII